MPLAPSKANSLLLLLHFTRIPLLRHTLLEFSERIRTEAISIYSFPKIYTLDQSPFTEISNTTRFYYFLWWHIQPSHKIFQPKYKTKPRIENLICRLGNIFLNLVFVFEYLWHSECKYTLGKQKQKNFFSNYDFFRNFETLFQNSRGDNSLLYVSVFLRPHFPECFIWSKWKMSGWL